MTALTRLPDWPQRLDAVLREWLAAPARCQAPDAPAQLVAACLFAVSGTVIEPDVAAIELALGEPNAAPLCLRVGDLGVVKTDDSFEVSVVVGAEALTVTDAGLWPISLSLLTAGWRVG